MVTANRYHDISCGHRVYGHESKCAHLHGHNYRVHFFVNAPALDCLGRVIDFSVIKTLLCGWLEENWDHKFILWDEDPWVEPLRKLDDTVTVVPFNPTAENLAQYLVKVIAPNLLTGLGIELVKCVIEETRKCSVTYTLHD